jgi:hypothetical protein
MPGSRGAWAGGPAAAAQPGAFASVTAPSPSPQAPQGFEANKGQFDERVAFMGRSFTGPVSITRDGRIIHNMQTARSGDGAGDAAGTKALSGSWSVTETLVGAAALRPQGMDRGNAPAAGALAHKAIQAPTYQSVLLGQAWPGIEVELLAHDAHMDKRFHVAPQADTSRIAVRMAGALELDLGPRGELIVRTGHGKVICAAPKAYQMAGQNRIEVPVQYELNTRRDGYRFTLGQYDKSRPLIILPWRPGNCPGCGSARPAELPAIQSAESLQRPGP